MKLLLHTCCGPCFLGVWEELGTHSDINTTLYYDNDNIYPEREWVKRRDNLRTVAKEKAVPLVEAKFEPDMYSSVIPAKAGIQENAEMFGSRIKSGMTNEVWASQETRCPVCYRYRLEKVAKYAKENGYDAFSTTLLVSPYQQHDKLRQIAEDVALHYGLDFYYTDWRPYFRGGQSEAKELDLYLQKYCGCKYSLAESGKVV